MPAVRDEDWTAIAAQAAAGATLSELAEHWNIPLGTLKDRCAAGGWKRIAREVQAQKLGIEEVNPRHQVGQPRPTGPAVSLMGKIGARSKLRLARTVDKTALALCRQEPEKLLKNTQALRNTTGAWKDLHGDAPATGINLAIQVNASNVPSES